MPHPFSLLIGLVIFSFCIPSASSAESPVRVRSVADTTAADTTRTVSSRKEGTSVSSKEGAEPEVCPIACTPVPDTENYVPLPQRATLSYWSEVRRRMILDREHSVGEQFHDRGVFRHTTRFVDREYELDLVAYRFSPFEDEQWMRASGGIRLRAGSVERDLFAIETELKNTVPLGTESKHYFSINGILREDPQVQQAWLEMSYAYQIARQHAVGLRHTFSQYKYDLDITPFYEYASPSWGRASVAVTILDAYSNFIYERLGINEEIQDVLRIYETKPYLFNVSYRTPTQYAFRGEITAGFQPNTRSAYTSQTSESYRFQETVSVHYLSAMIEYHCDPVSAGVYIQRDASRLSRTSTGDSLDTSYRTEQTQQRIGAYVRGTWRNFRLRANAFTGFYDDIQSGESFDTSTLNNAFSFTTETNGIHSRLVYEPDGWPFFGVEYLSFMRRLPANGRALVPWSGKYWDIGPDNYRVVGLIGYRFRRGSVAMGIGYDTDGDFNRFKPAPLKRFDNGFFRFAMTW